jgi:hypothetical protein
LVILLMYGKGLLNNQSISSIWVLIKLHCIIHFREVITQPVLP